MWCKNKIKGIAINPENEIALPMLTRSLMIGLEGFRKNWKKISDKSEVKITITIFIIKSLNSDGNVSYVRLFFELVARPSDFFKLIKISKLYSKSIIKLEKVAKKVFLNN